MGSDDLFKKRREARKKRNREFRNTNTDSYLIITEGTKTEPFYLNGLKRQILQKVGGAISVVNLNRHQWNDKLNVLFREYGRSEDGYEKNYENLYELLDSIGGVETAIKNAKRRMAEYDAKNCKPSLYAPGTTVHVLVEELKEYLK